MKTNATAVVLFAHGARDPAWARPLEVLQQQVMRRAPGVEVRIAFLELLQPALPLVLDELAASHRQVDLLPVFWAATGHVSRELPLLLATARQQHPTLAVRVLPPLSELPGLLESVADTVVSGLAAQAA
jgi:sirohydrochlorin cobaltochelatase